MFSLFKKKSNEPVPEWAPFSKRKEYDTFIYVVNRYFKTLGPSYTIFPDGVIELNDEFIFGGGQIGLKNLAMVCNQHKPSAWDELVTGHFETLKKNQSFSKEFYSKIHDFGYAEQYIAVRLYPASVVGTLDETAFIKRPFAEGIFAILAFDLPDAITNIKPDQALPWNKGNDELFDIGIRNIQRKYQNHIEERYVNESRIWLVVGDHFFVPNFLLDTDAFTRVLGKYGALVSAPTRHTVLVYPIDTIDVVRAINQLIPVTYDIHREGPGAIRSNIYWYTEGKYIDMPYTLKDSEIVLSPPPEFTQMLAKMAADK